MQDKIEVIAKLKSEKIRTINTLIQYFKTKNIEFFDTDVDDLQNVAFKYNTTNKTIKIANELFYRYSGMIKYFKQTETKGKVIFGTFEIVTDDMFYERMKILILYSFGIENK